MNVDGVIFGNCFFLIDKYVKIDDFYCCVWILNKFIFEVLL